MNIISRTLVIAPLCAGLGFGALALAAPSGTARFAEHYDLIYQIRDVATKAAAKSSIGSGFQISANGLIATNFHVVSGYVRTPERRRIEYLDQAGNTGTLRLLDFDVVNDLALLRHERPSPRYFELAPAPLARGELIYALGNPHDLGITLVFGANNGMVEHSYNPQILFSGSLNPGMSGGPGLGDDGAVVGINVATAGNQLSFLVPVVALERLVAAGRTLAPSGYDAEITRQISAWQQRRYAALLDQPWPIQRLGEHRIPGELRHDFQCWGTSNEDDKDANVRALRSSCNAGNSIYLGATLNTGQIHYSFAALTSLTLPPYRFHTRLDNQPLSADNAATSDDVTAYECKTDFLATPAGRATRHAGFTRAAYCVRAYKRLEGLYDVLFLGERSSSERVLNTHYTLAGVDRSLALAFATRFLEVLSWQ